MNIIVFQVVNKDSEINETMYSELATIFLHMEHALRTDDTAMQF